MTTPLWIAQGFLALVFAMAGGMKLALSKEKLVEMMGVLRPLSSGTIKAIGTLEVLGAVGVIVPVLIEVLPGVVGWAALGLALTMVGAAIAHARRGEWPMIGMNLFLGTVAVFVVVRHGLS